MLRIVGSKTVHILTSFVFCFILLLVNNGGMLAIGTVPSVGNKNVRFGEYFAYSDDLGSLEQDILYHDINGVTSQAKNSDILFVGNSRMQMGWDQSLLRKMAKDAEVKIYNLSCGNSEGIAYFGELFKKNNIKNKIVVVNVDMSTKNVSPPASNAMRGSWQSRVRSVLKKTSDFHSKAIAESFLSEPTISFIDHKGYYGRIRATLLRDVNDGFWIYRYWGGMTGRGKVCSSEKRGLDEQDKTVSKLARFMQIMAENNNFVVLVQVPSSDSSPGDVEFAQRITGRESILYSQNYDRLYTFDGSHLNLESATLFTQDVLPKVIALSQKRIQQRKTAASVSVR